MVSIMNHRTDTVYEFEKHVWQKVLEVVKKESAVQPNIDSVDHYHD